MSTIQTTEQLHQCIILANTPSSNDSSTASSMLDSMCSAQDGGSKLCTALLRQIFQNMSDASVSLYPITNENQQIINILFYSLTAIQRALTKDVGKDKNLVSVDKSCRIELRQIIFKYILCVGNGGSEQMYTSMLPKFLRTKVGVVLCLLVQADFPENWPSAFQDLTQTMNFSDINNNDQQTKQQTLKNLPFSVVQEVQRKDIFLRMLDAFCDEVVEKTEHEKNTLIKNVVRGFSVEKVNNPISPETSISAALIEYIFRVFQWSHPFININIDNITKQGVNELLRLPAKAIAVLKRYIPWVELSLILNENITSLLYSCLASAGPGDDDNDGSLPSQVAVQVLECLKEIVDKGMENPKKVTLIMNMRILDKLATCNLNLTEVDGTHITVVIKVAELINSIGLELITFWDNQYLIDSAPLPDPNLNGMGSMTVELKKLVTFFFYVFAYDDIDVSGAVIPFAVRLIALVEKETQIKVNPSQFMAKTYILQIMAIMHNQMQYPSDFQYDYEDEDEAEEEMYRNELRKLNQAITRICPNENLQFICQVLSKIEMPLSTAPTPNIEVALRLVYHYCEGIRPVPGINVVMKNDTFKGILISLHSSDITAHQHREVILLYYDISVRYAKILKERTDLLPNLLNSLTGSRGLQHQQRRVRSRSCYLLLKLVKALGNVVRPFVEPAIRGILDLLSNESTLPLDPDDTLYLFETVGLLLGKSGLDGENQRTYLAAIITPNIQRITSTINDPNLHRDPDFYGGTLAYNLAGLAFLSKGFSKKISPGVQKILLETVPIVLNILQSLPDHAPVRDKCMIYLQRMILCLGDMVLLYLQNFLELLIKFCTNEDILDVAQLLNQTCFKFKKKAVPHIDVLMLPFLEKCQQSLSNLLPTTPDKDLPPHLMTEKCFILKIMYSFLHQIVSTQCTEILLSATNISSLEDILGTMGEGATSVPDPVMKKTCMQFFRMLINQWMSGDCKVEEIIRIQSGFTQFLLKKLLPEMLNCLNSKGFDEEDAMYYRVVREVAAVLSDMKPLCRITDLEGLLVSQKLPSDISQHFMQAQTPVEMEECLKRMMKLSKD